MRFLLGIIVGIGLTIGAAYIHDGGAKETTGSGTSSARPMVNWDVVDQNWQRATTRLRQEWDRIAAK